MSLFKAKKKNTPIGGHRTMNEVVAWLETHGIDRSTAAQIMGFLRAFDIKLPMINLCNYGLTYSFNEFVEWFYSKPEDTTPKENSVCIFWGDDNQKALVGVLKEIKGKPGYPKTTYEDHRGYKHKFCMRFDNLAQFRTLLNTPSGEDIPLPQMEYVRLAESEINKKQAQSPKKSSAKPQKLDEKVDEAKK